MTEELEKALRESSDFVAGARWAYELLKSTYVESHPSNFEGYLKDLREIKILKEVIELQRRALEFVEEENAYIDENGNHVARQALEEIDKLLGEL